MDKKTIKKMLEGATKKDFIEIISKMSARSTKAEKVIIDWCKKNNEKSKKQAIEIEFGNLWKEARGIISMFNMYGGSPESDEDKAADNLWKMHDIVKDQDISWEVRVTILDEMLEQFNIGNSGFDDLLIDVAASFCKETEEKRYLADALAGGENDYYSGYAARIYKSIGDNGKFLETKLDNLRYGTDYIEVAEYYARQGEEKKALDYIWKGLKNCDGRLDELIDYAAPIYRKERNDEGLLRLYQVAKKTKWDINIVAIAKQLYEYSQEIGNYDVRKKMLLLILDTCDASEVEEWFENCKRDLQKEDWEKEYDNILKKARKKDERFYLDICMQTGKEALVLEKLQNARHGYDFWDLDYDGYFSKRLFKKYPDEVLALYWRDVHLLLSVSNNKNYGMAERLLRKIKPLMKKNGETDKWEKQFGELKERHKRKKNFMALLGDL